MHGYSMIELQVSAAWCKKKVTMGIETEAVFYNAAFNSFLATSVCSSHNETLVFCKDQLARGTVSSTSFTIANSSQLCMGSRLVTGISITVLNDRDSINYSC